MASMSDKYSEFERGERDTHPVKGSGAIYEDQTGFENAMVEFVDRRSVVIAVPAGELKRSYLD